MAALLTADGLLALATLTAMEIVLGIDNVVFIAILVGRCRRRSASAPARLGLIARDGHPHPAAASLISWIMRLTSPLFTVLGRGISGRDLILLGGGLFLIAQGDARDPREARGRGARGTADAAARAALRLACSCRSCCSTSCSRSTR